MNDEARLLLESPAMRCFCLVALLALAPAVVWAQRGGPEPDVVELWPAGAPGAKGTGAADTPTLSIYLPPAERSVGTAVVVCPGGGYRNLAMDHEGDQIARCGTRKAWRCSF